MEVEIKATVWDIGGVLLEDPQIADFWKGIGGAKELRTEFGSGNLSEKDFISKGASLLGMNEAAFLEDYKKAYFNVEPLTDVLEIYKGLQVTPRYILSDTNPLHARFITEAFPYIFDLAKKSYFSYEVKMRKNSSNIFNHVIEDVGLKPEEFLFIDNKQEIVEIAKGVGMNVIQFTEVNKLKQDLNRFGVK